MHRVHYGRSLHLNLWIRVVSTRDSLNPMIDNPRAQRIFRVSYVFAVEICADVVAFFLLGSLASSHFHWRDENCGRRIKP